MPVSPCSPSAPGLSGGRALPCCQLRSGERGQPAVSRARGWPPAPGTAQRNPGGGDCSALLSPCSRGLAPLSPQCSEGLYLSRVAAGGTHRAAPSARPTQTYTSQRGATMRTASQGPPGSASGPALRPATSTACSCGEEEDAVTVMKMRRKENTAPLGNTLLLLPLPAGWFRRLAEKAHVDVGSGYPPPATQTAPGEDTAPRKRRISPGKVATPAPAPRHLPPRYLQGRGAAVGCPRRPPSSISPAPGFAQRRLRADSRQRAAVTLEGPRAGVEGTKGSGRLITIS